MIGDLNTGLHRLDEAGATFHCAAAFAALPKAGWDDAWRLCNGAAREFSWFSAAGNGFRIDHAFASCDLAGRIVAASYDHSAREGLTDHSALMVAIGWPEGPARGAQEHPPRIV